jgi:hypothetical protein
MSISKIVTPSSYYIARILQQYLASHYLFYNPIVTNGATGNIVGIDQWRLYEGFPLNTDLLYCTVTPLMLSNYASPHSNSATAVYDAYNLSKHGYTQSTFYSKITFEFLSSWAPGDNIDTYEIAIKKVWDETKNHPDGTVPITGETTTTVDYNPYIEVISEYLEITRLAINDIEQQKFYLKNLNVHNIICNHSGLLSGPWEQNKNLLSHKGYVMIQTLAYVPTQWRTNDYNNFS